MEVLLGAQVLQKANRNMRVSIGDILTYGLARSTDEYQKLGEAIYRPESFDRLRRKELLATHGTATVFCWLFQNMTASIAEPLNARLREHPAYLGAMDVKFSNPFHLRFFRNQLMEKYRLHGLNASMFFDMGYNDPDLAVKETFESHGFQVSYEDTGARGTIFDNFDSLNHFTRVNDFRRIFSKMAGLSDEKTDDVILTMEEVHPRLFDTFAAAARTLERAETQEDYAQSALSGRRILEGVADTLFPARTEPRRGRKVGRAEFKNRLWAYIEDALERTGHPKEPTLTTLGKETDRLIELFNAGLHANPAPERIKAAFGDLVLWVAKIIDISPEMARQPYLAYGDELMKFWEDILKDVEEK